MYVCMYVYACMHVYMYSSKIKIVTVCASASVAITTVHIAVVTADCAGIEVIPSALVSSGGDCGGIKCRWGSDRRQQFRYLFARYPVHIHCQCGKC